MNRRDKAGRAPFKIDPKSDETLTRQVVSGLRAAIAAKVYDLGDRLPPRRLFAKQLGVSECTVRAAFAELVADHLIAGRVGRGFTIVGTKTPETRKNHLVLDVSTENYGSYSSCVNRIEFARQLAAGGVRPLSVILGADGSAPYLRPLERALALKPDFVLIRTSACRRKIVARIVAEHGCPYATITLGRAARSPGRFIGNYTPNSSQAMADFVDDCQRARIRSVLQVDFGEADTYINAQPSLAARRIPVERLSIKASGPTNLDNIVLAAEEALSRRLATGRRPDLIFVSDDYLALGVCSALRQNGILVPKGLRLVVLANRGSGLFPTSDIARFEFDPRFEGRELGRCVLRWLSTGELGHNAALYRYLRGDSFPIP